MGIIQPKEIKLQTGEKAFIRSADPADAQSILELVHAVLPEPGWAITRPDEFKLTLEDEKEWVKKHAENPCWVALVAEASGKVIGMLNFENETRKRIAHAGTLHISVLKEWRSKGAGKALIRTLIEWAEPHPEIEKLCLTVFATNARAIHLYEQLGFREEGRRRSQVKLAPGEYVDEVLMAMFVK